MTNKFRVEFREHTRVAPDKSFIEVCQIWEGVDRPYVGGYSVGMSKILEMVDEGLLDMKTVLEACLGYMSEDDVADVARANDIDLEDEDDEQVDNYNYDSYDGQPDEAQEWHDFDPDC